jgi:NAD(P)-dependent dehydrogenase (short-subunit alcohol dehydrogenase family)
MTTGTSHGRIALVTGGSRGIGAAIVRSLAQAGAALAVNYRERTGEANALVNAMIETDMMKGQHNLVSRIQWAVSVKPKKSHRPS